MRKMFIEKKNIALEKKTFSGEQHRLEEDNRLTFNQQENNDKTLLLECCLISRKLLQVMTSVDIMN